jgi:hypothetical protein
VLRGVELRRTWEEVVMVCFKVLSDISGGTEENHENLSQGSQFWGWDFNFEVVSHCLDQIVVLNS